MLLLSSPSLPVNYIIHVKNKQGRQQHTLTHTHAHTHTGQSRDEWHIQWAWWCRLQWWRQKHFKTLEFTCTAFGTGSITFVILKCMHMYRKISRKSDTVHVLYWHFIGVTVISIAGTLKCPDLVSEYETFGENALLTVKAVSQGTGLKMSEKEKKTFRKPGELFLRTTLKKSQV